MCPQSAADKSPNMAKRIICFVSEPKRMEHRLTELKAWLRNCGYPTNVIDKGIHNARLIPFGHNAEQQP